MGVQVIIWDEIGRELTFPEDAVTPVLQPRQRAAVPFQPHMPGGEERILAPDAFTWGELEDEPYASLEPCPACAPQPRLKRS